MKYLLDTHYLLWSIADSNKIGKSIREIIIDPQYQILVSTISFWEISLKYSLGKLNIQGFLPQEIPDLCLKMNFEIITLSSRESSSYYQLDNDQHKDPFDRMLIWQAIENNYTLITKDAEIEKYVSSGLKILK